MAVAGLLLMTGRVLANETRPPIVLLQADGDAVFRLSDAKGRYVALHFLLKTTCPYCIRHTHEVWQRAAELPEVLQVFIKPDTEEEIRTWSVRLGREFEAEEADDLPMIYRDPDAALAKRLEIPFGYKFHGQTVHYPALVLMGPDGRELFRYVGKSNSDRFSFDQLKEKVAELQAERAKGE
jgi:peroxiredoxin Q/BCP